MPLDVKNIKDGEGNFKKLQDQPDEDTDLYSSEDENDEKNENESITETKHRRDVWCITFRSVIFYLWNIQNTKYNNLEKIFTDLEQNLTEHYIELKNNEFDLNNICRKLYIQLKKNIKSNKKCYVLCTNKHSIS